MKSSQKIAIESAAVGLLFAVPISLFFNFGWIGIVLIAGLIGGSRYRARLQDAANTRIIDRDD